ncbi:MAG: VOC family protein [Acidobacteriota bacterium]
MSQPGHHHKINYIELAATDIPRAKEFWSRAFGWKFQDWGPDYIGFDAGSAGIDGGFRKAAPQERSGESAPLIVLYSADLKATEAAVLAAGGTVTIPVYEFPGGRRFHFSDGAGNVAAVWSE